jgi:hypothetical protein
MNKRYQKVLKSTGLFGSICGMLTGLPVMAMPQMADTELRFQLNSSFWDCNSVPDNCFPITPVSIAQIPPLPEPQQPPITVISPINHKVNIKLVNETGASINYQVIGETNQRSLPGKYNMTLLDLKTPTTVTFQRQDHGLLRVIAQPSNVPGTLTVNFTKTTDFSQDKTTLNIQQNGNVYLN